jgi:hypothetical protein
MHKYQTFFSYTIFLTIELHIMLNYMFLLIRWKIFTKCSTFALTYLDFHILLWSNNRRVNLEFGSLLRCFTRSRCTRLISITNTFATFHWEYFFCTKLGKCYHLNRLRSIVFWGPLLVWCRHSRFIDRDLITFRMTSLSYNRRFFLYFRLINFTLIIIFFFARFCFLRFLRDITLIIRRINT